MPKVEMPRASWESLLAMLSMLDSWHVDPTQVDIMYREISEQVYSQEY
jgi:hypothetical protein